MFMNADELRIILKFLEDNYQHNHIGAIMLKINELDGKLLGIYNHLREAFTELTAKIEQLQFQLTEVPIPEAAEQTLDDIENVAKILADMVPNPPPEG